LASPFKFSALEKVLAFKAAIWEPDHGDAANTAERGKLAKHTSSVLILFSIGFMLAGFMGRSSV
jgi:hypothetical protein